jgi:hypothetical protein
MMPRGRIPARFAVAFTTAVPVMAVCAAAPAGAYTIRDNFSRLGAIWQDRAYRTVTVIDSTNANWHDPIRNAVADWDRAPQLSFVLQQGAADPPNGSCRAPAASIRICVTNYKANMIDQSTVAGWISLFLRRGIACRVIGTALALPQDWNGKDWNASTKEFSCMSQTWQGNEGYFYVVVEGQSAHWLFVRPQHVDFVHIANRYP